MREVGAVLPAQCCVSLLGSFTARALVGCPMVWQAGLPQNRGCYDDHKGPHQDRSMVCCYFTHS